MKGYQVEILSSMDVDGFEREENTYAIIDQHVLTLYPTLKSVNSIEISATEQTKTLETVGLVIESLRTLGASRESHLIAIGGGVIQDVATFAASTYMRGIAWTYYPTTLLGMVDSCVGGKSSINVGQYKNIAGNFYPPKKIIINTAFCATLPTDEMIAGLCEAVKICFADTGNAFDQYLSMTDKSGLIPQTALTAMIELSLRTKKQFIEKDEFDKGVRLLLNYGHTFGHSIEAASHFTITHGVAVGVGMLIAIEASEKISLVTTRSTRAQALYTYVSLLLGHVSSLPGHLAALSSDEAFRKFKSDKKHRQQEYAVIIPDAHGCLFRKFIPINDSSDTLIRNAFESIKVAYEV
jgi:3-dehydroquinate synthase